MSQPVVLRPLTRRDLPTVESWFEDSQTNRYLGGRDWPSRMLELGEKVIGAEFRGATQTGAYRFIASQAGRPIGMIDCGVFDRWTRYAGEGRDGPIIAESNDVTTGSIAFVVDPTRRDQALGRAMIEALLMWPELADVRCSRLV